MKPGWQTTEFWVTLLAMGIAGGVLVLAILGLTRVGDPQRLVEWSMGIIAASGGAYALARGVAKKSGPP